MKCKSVVNNFAIYYFFSIFSHLQFYFCRSKNYGVDYYTGRRATIEQRISGEVTYRNLDYLSGFGDTGEVYYLRAECSPEAGSNKDIQIKGTWIP